LRCDIISDFVVAIVQIARVCLLQQSVLNSSIQAVVSLEWNIIRNRQEYVDNARYKSSVAMYLKSSPGMLHNVSS
jgi:hypothetical protein